MSPPEILRPGPLERGRKAPVPHTLPIISKGVCQPVWIEKGAVLFPNALVTTVAPIWPAFPPEILRPGPLGRDGEARVPHSVPIKI